MYYRSSAHEHDQEALQELTPRLSQISFEHKDEIKLPTGLTSRRRQRLNQSMGLVSEVMDEMTQISEVMDQINDIYFCSNRALTEAIESANMASEFAQEINKMKLLNDVELATSFLAATSAATRNLASSRLATTSIMTRSLSY